MLSDKSSAFDIDEQNGLWIGNGVETSLHYFIDASTPFRVEQLKLTEERGFTLGRST
jgi:hypothetical protein